MISGAAANILDYGADPTGVADSSSAIQAALDASNAIVIPIGNFKVTTGLKLNSSNFVMGMGRGSVITSTVDGPLFAGKNVTSASGTNVRVYNGGGRDFSMNGPATTGGSIALDMRGCTGFKWFNLVISTFNTGVTHGLGYSSYYNEYHACDITTISVGYYNDSLGNENTVFGGRVAGCTIGTRDADCSHNKYIGVSLEVFTTGHLVVGPAALFTTYIASRLENQPTTGTAFSIAASAEDTQIISPYMAGVATEITDNGSRTNIIASQNWKISGGTRIVGRISTQATVNFSSIPANSTADIAVSITGVLTTDSAFVTPLYSLESGLIISALADGGGVILRAANVTTGAIDPASQVFRIDVWRNA
jgi:hypothetical protein